MVATRCVDISIVIPALNEAKWITAALNSTQGLDGIERIVVDGGSQDETREIAAAGSARVLDTDPGRAHQMNIGARAATGNLLLFLHADTRLPTGFAAHVRSILSRDDVVAGAFRLGIDTASPSLKLIETIANWRSHRLQMPYGDQGLFLKTETFQELGGFLEIPIMEDYEMAHRLRQRGRVVVAPATAVTSSRRWKHLGPWRTTLINQVMIAGFTLGVDPSRLARWYGR